MLFGSSFTNARKCCRWVPRRGAYWPRSKTPPYVLRARSTKPQSRSSLCNLSPHEKSQCRRPDASVRIGINATSDWESKRNTVRELANTFRIDLALGEHRFSFPNISQPQYATFVEGSGRSLEMFKTHSWSPELPVSSRSITEFIDHWRHCWQARESNFR